MEPYLAYIEWNDAVYNTNWFINKDLINWAEETNLLIKEVGWVVIENKDYICLGVGRKEEDDWSGEQWIGVHKIPKAWIKKKLKIIK